LTGHLTSGNIILVKKKFLSPISADQLEGWNAEMRSKKPNKERREK